MALIARFVDSIAATATVRLDVNDGDLWRLQATSRFDPPRAKRARASTLLTDGAQYPATAYDDRTLELRLLLEAETSDVVAGEVQKLAWELNRAGNFFEYRPDGASQSLFFRTHRLGLDAVDMPTDGTRLFLEVNVPAEPFAYGLKETLPQVVIANDPAAGSNGMYFDVTGVKGDVETPIQARFAYATPFGATVLNSTFAMRRRGTPANMPFLLQAETMTVDVDTALQANDPVMSGAGSNYMRCTFATATTLERRLWHARFPSASSVDARGTYRVYLRHRQSVGSDVMQVQVRYGRSDGVGSDFELSAVTLPSDTRRHWSDLGLLSIPIGQDPVYDGFSGIEIPVRGISVSLEAARLSGSGNLDFDALAFVPADDRFCTTSWPSETGTIDHVVLDGPTDAVYCLEGTSEIRATQQSVVPLGGIPMLSPGVTNRIYVMANTGAGSLDDSVTHTVTVVPAYWPRYLSVRPALS